MVGARGAHLASPWPSIDPLPARQFAGTLFIVLGKAVTCQWNRLGHIAVARRSLRMVHICGCASEMHGLGHIKRARPLSRHRRRHLDRWPFSPAVQPVLESTRREGDSHKSCLRWFPAWFALLSVELPLDVVSLAADSTTVRASRTTQVCQVVGLGIARCLQSGSRAPESGHQVRWLPAPYSLSGLAGELEFSEARPGRMGVVVCSSPSLQP
jgi:hypothetical protein